MSCSSDAKCTGGRLRDATGVPCGMMPSAAACQSEGGLREQVQEPDKHWSMPAMDSDIARLVEQAWQRGVAEAQADLERVRSEPDACYCSGCVQVIDPWDDSHEGYTYCCNKTYRTGREMIETCQARLDAERERSTWQERLARQGRQNVAVTDRRRAEENQGVRYEFGESERHVRDWIDAVLHLQEQRPTRGSVYWLDTRADDGEARQYVVQDSGSGRLYLVTSEGVISKLETPAEGAPLGD